MAKNVDRRIYYNDEDFDIVKNLRDEKPFKNLQLVDIFALSIIYGKKQGFRTPLDGKKTGIILKNTLLNSNVYYLMMAIAVEETGSFDILAKDDDFFTICEEYAKTGISFLQSDYLENSKRIETILELEALKYFDSEVDV